MSGEAAERVLFKLIADAEALLARAAVLHEGADAAIGEVRAEAAELRGTVEVAALELAEHSAVGYLADAAASIELLVRAVQAGDPVRAEDNREQAEYYLRAAEQSMETG